ncbi:hypothetical protein BGZ96_003269 [Linnemannia gamsii]|uniref:Integrating conjugative element protein, PFL_4669 family n=1 Tax=Linnemannia gamsii TaxID=64522 RepID=A0ABQ7K814_9FUNG|nr:hypothetical protein BGZ96_003269 [Linnemannia gamsii]
MVTKAPSRPRRWNSALNAFATSADSPFPDHYDLAAERKIVWHLLQSNAPDPADPFFARYELYCEREQSLKHMQAMYAARQSADALVPINDARKIKALGQLAAQVEDTMELHTVHAMRLFLGLAIRPGESGSPSAGGKRVAAALRALWSLSGNDNPYADWALIEVSNRIAEVRKLISAQQKRMLGKLDELKQKGLSYSILQAREPAKVRLGFVSPYGFMIALLLVEVDGYARIVKSAQYRDLISSQEGHQALQAVKHKCRSIFERAVYWQKYLTQDALIQLTRLDFLPTAQALAQARVNTIKKLFGAVPKDIFMGLKQPRHTKRHLNLSEAEYRLLEAVPLVAEAVSVNPEMIQLLP